MSFQVSAKVKTLTAKEAKKILGFRDAKENEAGGTKYTKEDGSRGKFVLDLNKDNRPLKSGIFERYCEQMFQGIFAGQVNHPSETCNGESIIIDANRQVTSGAHRLVGLILAQTRRDRLSNLGLTDEIEEFDVPETIELPTVLVEGIDPAAADTVDIGQTRSLGDVLYRRHAIAGKELTNSQKAAMNRELATAVRLVWTRLAGNEVRGAGKLPFPEAVSFLEAHPRLTTILEFCYGENEANALSNLISLGYLAGIAYLAAFQDADRGEFENGKLDLKSAPKKWDKAEKWVTMLSQMARRQIKADDNKAAHALVSVLDGNVKSDHKFSRDALCTLLVRGWQGFLGEESYHTAGGLKKALHRKVGDKEILTVDRLGGLDLDKETLRENGWIKVPTPEVRMTAGAHKVGDLVWIDQPDVEPWFGEIEAIDDNGEDVNVKSKDDGTTYGCKLAWLTVDKPERAMAAPAQAPPAKPSVKPSVKTKAKASPKAKVPPASAKVPPASAKVAATETAGN